MYHLFTVLALASALMRTEPDRWGNHVNNVDLVVHLAEVNLKISLTTFFFPFVLFRKLASETVSVLSSWTERYVVLHCSRTRSFFLSSQITTLHYSSQIGLDLGN